MAYSITYKKKSLEFKTDGEKITVTKDGWGVAVFPPYSQKKLCTKESWEDFCDSIYIHFDLLVPEFLKPTSLDEETYDYDWKKH